MAMQLPVDDFDAEPRHELALGALFDLAGMDHESWLWRLDAACHGQDPELFFPEVGASTSAAKAICRPCPVRADCLEHALRHEKNGIWGGTSQKERTRMRQRMGIHLIELAPSDDELHDIEDDDNEEDEWQ